MMNQTLSIMRSRTALTALVVALAGSAVQADEADAKQILQRMSDYLAGEATISFDYDATLEIVTTEDQKLGITSSGTVAVSRPDKIRMTRTGGFADVEMVYDGATFSLLGKHAAMYTQLPIKGDVDYLVDELRETYGRPLPAADLLASDPYDILMSEVTDIKDLGVGVVRGEICDHLAFRTPDVDWQIWISTGKHAHPCRYEITSKAISQGPQYRVDIRHWHGNKALPDDTFAFTPPAGTTEVKFDDIKGSVGVLPDHYVMGDAK